MLWKRISSEKKKIKKLHIDRLRLTRETRDCMGENKSHVERKKVCRE